MLAGRQHRLPHWVASMLQDSWYLGRIGSSRMLLVALIGETTPFLTDFFEAMASASWAPPRLPR